MSSRTSRSVAVASLLGAILIGGLMAGPVKAQSNNPLDALLAMMTSLQNSVNALQASMNASIAPAQANVRITPVLGSSSHDVSCTVVNVSASTRTIRIENIGVVVEPLVTTDPMSPGAIFAIIRPDATGPFYCRFTVIDGTRTDIRGSIRVKSSASLEPGTVLAAE
jgi:hypothetical protein